MALTSSTPPGNSQKARASSRKTPRACAPNLQPAGRRPHHQGGLFTSTPSAKRAPLFDDHRLMAYAGLPLTVTLTQRLGLRELAESHVDLGDAAGRANTGDKMLTLVASALAGGDCIDDVEMMRADRIGRVLGCTVKAPSTLGTLLRGF